MDGYDEKIKKETTKANDESIKDHLKESSRPRLVLKTGAAHRGKHCKPGGVSRDLDLGHRVVKAGQRLHRPFFS